MQWCLGMYASGSTWMFNVVRQITAVLSPGLGVTGRFAETGVIIRELDAADPGLVIKTHDTDERLAAWLSEHATRVWITVRDPRDCVTSLMLYQDYAFEEALEATARSARHCARFAGHPQAVLFRYEAGFTDRIETLDMIAEALGSPLPPIERARLFTMSRRRQIEAEITRRVAAPTALQIGPGHRMDPQTQWHDHHRNRSGEVGRWRHMLSEGQLRRAEAVLDAPMAAFGYAPAHRSVAGA